MAARVVVGVIASALAIVLGPLPTSGASLIGMVSVAENGSALDFVNVVAVQIDGTDRGGASSEENGSYLIGNLDPGLYRVTGSRIGYQTSEDTLTISGATSFDLQLVEDAIPMDGVEIHGDRFQHEEQVSTGFVNFDQEVIKSLPAIGEPDPIRALQMLPGIQASSDISSGLYVRGGGPDQTLVTLDGVAMYNPTHAFGFFSTFNADAVDGVTLYKGAYPAEYGGRLGSVVDVRSSDAESPEIRGEAGLSSITGRLMLEGPIGEEGARGGWAVSGRRTFLEPILDATRTESNEIPSYYFYDLNGKAQIRSGESGRWEFGVYQGSDHLFFDLEEDTSVKLEWGNRTLSMKYSQIVGTAFLGTVQLSTSEYRSDNKIRLFSTPFDVRNRLFDVSLRGELEYEVNSAHRLRTGLLASRYDFQFKQEFNREEQIDFQKKPVDVSAFFQDEWTPNDDLNVQPGLRLRYFSDGDLFLVEPRFSYSDKLSDRFRLKIGTGVYHQYLQLISTEGFSAGDFYVPIDDTTKPSRSIQGVLGLTFEPNVDYQITAETYYTALKDLVVFDNNASPGESELTAESLFVTGGKGWASGLELFLQKRTGDLTGWIGYTLGWTRRTFSELNEGEEFPPKYDRRHDINMVSRYQRGKWTYAASYIYGTGQSFTPASALYALEDPSDPNGTPEIIVLPGEKNSARLLPYSRLDVSVSKNFQLFGKNATWMLQIFNLYSRRNEWFIQYDTSDLTTEPEVVKMLPLIPSLGVEFEF